MTDYELDRLEREANERLYAVDPDFARELGYEPPPQPDPEQAHRFQEMLANCAQQQPSRSLMQQMQGQGSLQQGLRVGHIGSALGNPFGMLGL